MTHTRRCSPHLLAPFVLTFALALGGPGCARRAGPPAKSSATALTERAPQVPGTRVAGLGSAGGRPISADRARRIVRNATVRLEVKNARAVQEAIARARRITQELGGYVSREHSGGLVARVPAERLDTALQRITSLGRVARRQISAEDVTARYVDLEVRLENARRLQARLRELLKRTSEVPQILAVEKELARVTEQLERLEGQIRLLRNQSAYATIDLGVREAVRPGPLGWIFKGLYLGTKWLFVWD